ncbi:McrC family protein [Phycicoccus jejuensis]|uniref:McrC family protein n=1 Tax=Phycicoccus jejuensis TaxID=367299 RepID=UPI00384D020E
MSRADLGSLKEGQRLSGVDLTRAEAAALNRSGLVTVQPDLGGWSVAAQFAVASVHRADLTVRVTPKMGLVRVLTLLARAHGVSGLKIDAEYVDVGTAADLSAVPAMLFSLEAATAMAAGPLRGYRAEDQTLPGLRGRLRMREQYLRRYGLPAPLEVTVDEWTLDTDDNRRLRAATQVLLAQPGVPAAARQGLLRLDRMLGDARVPPAGTRWRAWVPTRLNVRLHRLLHLADIALAHAGVEHDKGDTSTRGFVVNMAWLFEALVTRLLRERTHGLAGQDTMPLDTLGRLTIRPDLVWYGLNGRPVAVADTKYKLLDDKGSFPNADAYQFVTYCARLGLRTGHLIYAAGDPQPDPYDIFGADVTIHIHAVDITRPLADIETQVDHLAQKLLPAMRDPRSSPMAGASHWQP